MELETGLSHKSVKATLPSDIEEAVAKLKGLNYTQIRSRRVKVYTKDEIDEFAKSHPDMQVPFAVWKMEKEWRQLIQSRSCKPRGERK
jgi:hypothetical protein